MEGVSRSDSVGSCCRARRGPCVICPHRFSSRSSPPGHTYQRGAQFPLRRRRTQSCRRKPEEVIQVQPSQPRRRARTGPSGLYLSDMVLLPAAYARSMRLATLLKLVFAAMSLDHTFPSTCIQHLIHRISHDVDHPPCPTANATKMCPAPIPPPHRDRTQPPQPLPWVHRWRRPPQRPPQDGSAYRLTDGPRNLEVRLNNRQLLRHTRGRHTRGTAGETNCSGAMRRAWTPSCRPCLTWQPTEGSTCGTLPTRTVR